MAEPTDAELKKRLRDARREYDRLTKERDMYLETVRVVRSQLDKASADAKKAHEDSTRAKK